MSKTNAKKKNGKLIYFWWDVNDRPIWNEYKHKSYFFRSADVYEMYPLKLKKKGKWQYSFLSLLLNNIPLCVYNTS